MFIDYYELLEVAHTASQAEIKSAYRKQSIKWHPDVNSSENATEKMQLLNEAYLILKDPEARERYNVEYLRYQSFRAKREKEEAHASSSDNNSKTQEKKKSREFDFEDFKIKDELLKKWIQNARRQAIQLAKQSLEDTTGMMKAGAKAAIKEGSSYLVFYVAFVLIILVVVAMIRSCS
jgi:curved DNA-binding protein CbpA